MVLEPGEPRPQHSDVSRALSESAARLLGNLPTSWKPRDLWALFESAPGSCALLSLDGRRVAANQAYHDLFGYDREEMAHISGAAIIHPDERETVAEYERQLISGEIHNIEIDTRYVRRNGEVFWGHLVASALRDAEGEIWAVLSAIEDVTDRVDA